MQFLYKIIKRTPEVTGAKKVILMMKVSLDGHVARLDHDLSWLFGEPHCEAEEWAFSDAGATDTQLIGRVNSLERQLLSIHCPGSGLIEEYKLMAHPIALGADCRCSLTSST